MLLDDTFPGQWSVLAVNSLDVGISCWWFVQVVVVKVGHYLHAEAGFSPQYGPDIILIDQLAVQLAAVVSSPYSEKCGPTNRNRML